MTEDAFRSDDLSSALTKLALAGMDNGGAGTVSESLVREAVDFCLSGTGEDAEAVDLSGSDGFLDSLYRRMERGSLDGAVSMALFGAVRDAALTLDAQRAGDRANGRRLAAVSARSTRAAHQIGMELGRLYSNARLEVSEKERQIERLQDQMVKFVSKRGRGWIDVGGTRMCLLDVSNGWLRLAEAMKLFAGEDTYKRALFEAGQRGTFPGTALERRIITRSPEGFRDAVDTFSSAGFGSFHIEVLRFSDGFARISCPDAFEAWALLQTGKDSSLPVCHYSTGVLLSFMEQITRRTDLVAAERQCIAKGDAECEFIVGTKEDLEREGVTFPEWGMTIKERAEYLENLLREKERVERKIKRKNEELLVLNKISVAVSQSLDLDEILNLAISELTTIAGGKSVGIYLIDEANQGLIFTAHSGFSEEFVKSISQLNMGEGLAGRVALERTPMAYDDYTTYPQAIEAAVKNENIKSLLSVPLMSSHKIVGVLNVASKSPYHFSQEEIDLMTLVGNQLGVAIAKARLHNELKESEGKYKTLVEDIDDGYFVCRGGHIVYANKAFLSMHGRESENVVGRDPRRFMSEESVRQINKVASDRMAGKPVPEYLEFNRKHKDGRELPTEAKMNFSHFGAQPAMIGIFRDVSERKRMEQKILENERLASIGKLTSAIAHEIRNPLSSIKTNIQILARNLDLEGFDKKRLGIALSEIKRLEIVLQEMLDFAKPMKMRMAPHPIDAIIEQCIDLLSPRLREAGIRIVRKSPSHPTTASIDPQRIQEAVLNLLLNAMDAMPDRGTIEISTTRETVQGKPMLRVAMTDSGSGISPEDIPVLFDPFFSTKTRGVGLGLSNVKRIVEAHGGSVVVDSQPGSGATFAILLPESRDLP